jgi:hypothetical protein
VSASRKWSDEHPTRLVAGWRNEYRGRPHGRHWMVVTLQFAGGAGVGIDESVHQTGVGPRSRCACGLLGRCARSAPAGVGGPGTRRSHSDSAGGSPRSAISELSPEQFGQARSVLRVPSRRVREVIAAALLADRVGSRDHGRLAASPAGLQAPLRRNRRRSWRTAMSSVVFRPRVTAEAVNQA